jgi:hypothetical protein
MVCRPPQTTCKSGIFEGEEDGITTKPVPTHWIRSCGDGDSEAGWYKKILNGFKIFGIRWWWCDYQEEA